MFQSALRMRGLFNHGEDAVQILVAVFQSALRMRGLFNSGIRSGEIAKRWFQSALRMRGLFNWDIIERSTSLDGFNPPCGCVAFSTVDGGSDLVNGQTVSIRLADAWPFQLRARSNSTAARLRFNPPCGCVAFSTWSSAATRFAQMCFNPPCGCVAFSTSISESAPQSGQARFNPPCGCVAFSTQRQPSSVSGPKQFQSALRMRGLFNYRNRGMQCQFQSGVSIRLADAWPFQQEERMRVSYTFPDVSIRLADAWPFQRSSLPIRDAKCPGFNPPCGCVAFSTPIPRRSRDPTDSFQSALRMRGLFNFTSGIV